MKNKVKKKKKIFAPFFWQRTKNSILIQHQQKNQEFLQFLPENFQKYPKLIFVLEISLCFLILFLTSFHPFLLHCFSPFSLESTFSILFPVCLCLLFTCFFSIFYLLFFTLFLPLSFSLSLLGDENPYLYPQVQT